MGSEIETVDCVVVGAGFAGLYQLYRFRGLGLATRVFDTADDVGGTWYWNRYPGARCDVESMAYSYSFSPELEQEWVWTERYATQPEILSYLDHVADRFDLRRDITFGTSVTAAHWDDVEARWTVTTDGPGGSETVTCRFLVMATGCLSVAKAPEIPGVDRFRGPVLHTGSWPHEGYDVTGKRVAVIGTGASGSQAVPEIAKEAASVHVLQRTANFCVPSRNRAIEEEITTEIRADVTAQRRKLWSMGGTRSAFFLADYHALTPDERVELMETQWAAGGHGMAYVFRTQGVDKAVNDVVADFVRDRIREIVHDPETAEKLCPRDHPIGSRRIVIESGYYDAFNSDHVSLVDLRAEPIETFTPAGIRTTAGEYEFDLVVLAMGFDAFTGALDATDIRNEHGATPTDHWDRRPQTLLGLMTTGFPNFFMFAGPGSPATLTNVWAENEYHADWVADCVAYLDDHGYRTIEPTVEGQDRWSEILDELSAPLLRRRVRNYMTHFNDDGTSYFIPYAGGLGSYVERADEIAAKGYEGFALGR